MVERIVESVYNKLVRKCIHCLTAVVENADTEKTRNGYPFVQLDATLMAKDLFDIAADPATNQFNRDKVYDVSISSEHQLHSAARENVVKS